MADLTPEAIFKVLEAAGAQVWATAFDPNESMSTCAIKLGCDFLVTQDEFGYCFEPASHHGPLVPLNEHLAAKAAYYASPESIARQAAIDEAILRSDSTDY